MILINTQNGIYSKVVLAAIHAYSLRKMNKYKLLLQLHRINEDTQQKIMNVICYSHGDHNDRAIELALLKHPYNVCTALILDLGQFNLIVEMACQFK